MRLKSTIAIFLVAILCTVLTLMPVNAIGQNGHNGGDNGWEDGMELRGIITAIGTSSITVNTTEILVNEQTEIEGQMGTDLSFSDLQVGQRVEVKVEKQSDGSYLALRIKVGMRMGQREVEVAGTIDAKTDTSLTVAGKTFLVIDQTVIMGDRRERLAFADLQVGQRVEVKGLLLAGDIPTALMIKVEDENEKDEVELFGFIEAVSQTSITVSGVTFAIDDNTVIVGSHRQPLTVDDLSVGQRVEVEGATQTDGTLLATKIEVKLMLKEQVEVTGVIEVIGADNIVVLGATFYIDSNTLILDDHRQTITLADLAVGQTVKVKAAPQTDGKLLAVRIVVEDFRTLQAGVIGEIESIDTANQTLTVLGLTFKVTAETKIVGAHRTLLSFADLQVGMRVGVRGVQQEDGSLLAIRIMVVPVAQAAMEIEGVITNLDQANMTLEVLGIVVKVDANTVILIEHDRLGTFADLAVGQRVEVKAKKQTDGSLLAFLIKIDDDLVFGMEMQGSVESVSGSSVTVAGSEFAVTSSTVVLDQSYNVVSSSQITTGETVYVWGKQQPGQVASAEQIQVTGVSTSAGKSGDQVAKTFLLHQNYPNPFNPSTTIQFDILEAAGASDVTLAVYNLMGQKVRTLVDAKMNSGSYAITWDGRDDLGAVAPSGVYFYELHSGSYSSIQKMVMTK